MQSACVITGPQTDISIQHMKVYHKYVHTKVARIMEPMLGHFEYQGSIGPMLAS